MVSVGVAQLMFLALKKGTPLPPSLGAPDIAWQLYPVYPKGGALCRTGKQLEVEPP